MQQHPMSRTLKVTNLTDIFDTLERSFLEQLWRPFCFCPLTVQEACNKMPRLVTTARARNNQLVGHSQSTRSLESRSGT